MYLALAVPWLNGGTVVMAPMRGCGGALLHEQVARSHLNLKMEVLCYVNIIVKQAHTDGEEIVFKTLTY